MCLLSFLEESTTINEMCQQITKRTGTEHHDFFEWKLGDILKELNYLEIKTISELEFRLKKKREIITEWAVLWLTPKPEDIISYFFTTSLPVLYLNYVLIAKSQSTQRIVEFLNLSDKGQLNKIEYANNIISTYQLLKKIKTE